MEIFLALIAGLFIAYWVESDPDEPGIIYRLINGKTED